MTLAFFAPLKPPTHETPSGDRQMARNLMAALEAAGFAVTLASTLRCRDGAGDAEQQKALIAQAEAEIPALISRGQKQGWRGWVTYHNYYKAPDLLGPQVSAALDIPYVQIESTRARKRLEGPWAKFAQLAETAADSANVIFYLTQRDAEALRRDAPAGQHLAHLAPFLPHEHLPAASACEGPMLSVGMFRKGDKTASYRLIAEALALLQATDWQLHIAGDGDAAAEIRALFAPFGRHVQFLGNVPPRGMGDIYTRASLLLWPGVNEAFGMTYLEAQSHGLPIVAQDRPGVRDVLAPGEYPAPEAGATGLAARIDGLLKDRPHRVSIGKEARAHVAGHHLLPAAARTLREGLAMARLAP